jgi:hypothetical protein
MIVNLCAFLFCLFLGFWPLVQDLVAGFESSPDNFANFVQSYNWTAFFSDLHWVGIAVGLFLLYMTWWSLLAALFDGAVYSQVSEHQKKESGFSFEGFFKAGFRYMLPMLGMQCCWLLIFLGAFLLGTIAAVVIGALFNLLGMPTWVIVLLCIPMGFAAILLLIYLGVSIAMTGAYLVDGKGVFDSIKSALLKTKENTGRVLWAFLLTFLIYAVISMASQGILDAFSHVPAIGFLFSLINLLVSLTLSMAFSVFGPALAVTLQLEEED